MPPIAVLILAAAAAQSQATPIYGSATVVDGDTLRMDDTRIRLFGIDAPELDQSCSKDGAKWQCGREAFERLSRLVLGKNVRCIPMGKDDYGRTLARCDTIGLELNQAMVEQGYATAFRRYSADYIPMEDHAKAGRRGIWAGTFVQPGDYRAKQRYSSRAAPRDKPTGRTSWSARSSSGCVIKGNHSRRGEWIYHLPGMPYYDQTRPEEIFCSEAEAQAAGYRRARVR
jgi:endonuclease YncB( thermonuclease family)